MSPAAGPRRAVAALVTGLVGLALLAGAGTPALATTPPPDPSSSATPDPSATPTPDPSGGATPDPSATPTPDPSASATPDPSAAPDTPADDDAAADAAVAAAGGVLYVSGVRTTYERSRDPRGGRLHLSLVVRNATALPLDATVEYGARALFGIDLGAGENIALRDLAPGDTRTVEATVDGVGQWGLLEAHMTLNPPLDVVGVEVTALERERWVFVPPWYLFGFVLVVALAVAAVVVLRRYPPRRRKRAHRGSRKAPPAPGNVVTAAPNPGPAAAVAQ